MQKKIRSSVRILAPSLVLAASLIAAPDAGAVAPVKTLKDGTLRVCLYSGFAPFASKDAAGNWQGWDWDYLKAFADSLNLHFEVIDVPFDGIWLLPGKGQCDIAGTGISDTAERRSVTKKTTTQSAGCWSTTYYGEVRSGAYYGVLRSFLVRNPDSTNLTKVEDLRGKTAIVTPGSTANVDLCYRMLLSNREAVQKKTPPAMFLCKKPCGDHPCKDLLPELEERDKASYPSCVLLDYPPYQNEANAGCAVANGSTTSGPFTYGGGYGSIVTLVNQSPGTALVWTHCNMTSYTDPKGKVHIEGFTEPFSFVVASQDTGLLKALNGFIRNNPTLYKGTSIPQPPSCPIPPWTLAPQPAACQE